jgi:hypothetical protein
MTSNQITQYVRETMERVHSHTEARQSLTLTDEQLSALRANGDSMYSEQNDSGRIHIARVLIGDAGGFHMDWYAYQQGVNAEYRERDRDRRASEREYNRIARILGVPEIHNYTAAH